MSRCKINARDPRLVAGAHESEATETDTVRFTVASLIPRKQGSGRGRAWRSKGCSGLLDMGRVACWNSLSPDYSLRLRLPSFFPFPAPVFYFGRSNWFQVSLIDVKLMGLSPAPGLLTIG